MNKHSRATMRKEKKERAETLHQRMDRAELEFNTLVQGLEQHFDMVNKKIFFLEETVNVLVDLAGKERVVDEIKKRAKERQKQMALEVFTLGIESGAITPKEVIDDQTFLIAKQLDSEGNVLEDFLQLNFEELHDELKPKLLGGAVGVKAETPPNAKGETSFIEVVGVYNLDAEKLKQLLEERNSPLVQAGS